MQVKVNKLEELVRGSGVDFRENRVSWIFACPRCRKKDKVYLRKKDGRFVCWYCATIDSYQGRPEILLKDLLGRSIKDLREVLYGAAYDISDGVQVAIEFSDFFEEKEEIPEELHKFLPLATPAGFRAIDHPSASRGLQYLTARGIPLQAAKYYRLRYSPEERRVIFPIEVGGVCVGWQARTVEQTEIFDEVQQKTFKRIKVLTQCGPHVRDRALMFQDRMQNCDHAVLCEGPVDAIKCHMAGGNVAAMGKSVSEDQVETILRSGVKKVYLGLDPDAAREITRLCRRMCSVEVFLMSVPPGLAVPKDFTDLSKGTKEAEDFGDMGFKQALQCFRDAKKVVSSLTFLPPATDFFSVRGFSV